MADNIKQSDEAIISARLKSSSTLQPHRRTDDVRPSLPVIISHQDTSHINQERDSFSPHRSKRGENGLSSREGIISFPRRKRHADVVISQVSGTEISHDLFITYPDHLRNESDESMDLDPTNSADNSTFINTLKSVCNMERKADFLLSLALFAEAYQVYLRMSDCLIRTIIKAENEPFLSIHSETLATMERNALSGCVRSATTEGDLHIIRDRLSHSLVLRHGAIAKIREGEDNSPFYLLLTNVCGYLGDNDGFKSYLSVICEDLSTRGQPTWLDLASYPYFHLIRPWINHTASKRSTAQSPVAQLETDSVDRVFDPEKNPLMHTCIVNCVYWCIDKLRNSNLLPKFRNVYYNTHDETSAQFITLFLFLWNHLNDDQGHYYFRRSPWAPASNASAGLSDTEFLALICSTLLSNVESSQRETNFSRISHVSDTNQNLHEIIILAAEKLLDLPSSILLNKIKEHYTSQIHSEHPSAGVQWTQGAIKSEVQSFMLEVLGIGSLVNNEYVSEDVPVFTDDYDNQAMDLEWAETCPLKNPFYNPTLAPSLSSSSESYMKRLAVRINQNPAEAAAQPVHEALRIATFSGKRREQSYYS